MNPVFKIPVSSGSIHDMHLKEDICLKCFVIIGRKVRLDYTSWYASLPLIRHVGSSGSTLIAGRKSRERESKREGERETARCLHTILLFWLCFLEVWVSQSILLQLHPNPNLSCPSAFVRQSRTFHSINALCTFYRMHTFLN